MSLFTAPKPKQDKQTQEGMLKLFKACSHKNERKITERSIFFDDYVCADCGEFLRRETVK